MKTNIAVAVALIMALVSLKSYAKASETTDTIVVESEGQFDAHSLIYGETIHEEPTCTGDFDPEAFWQWINDTAQGG
jgi:hypothetical protein